MNELKEFQKKLEDIKAKALPKGVPYIEVIEKPLDLHPHIKHRQTTHKMKCIGSGHIPFGDSGILHSEVIFPLEFHVFHDGNWEEPPIVFIHNLNDMDDGRRPLDVFNKIYVQGTFHAINKRIYDYVNSENEEKSGYLGVLLYAKDKLVEFGANYISSGHAESWVYLDGFSDTNLEIPKYLYKFVAHLPEFDHVKHIKHDINDVYQSIRKLKVSKALFYKALHNTILVTENSQANSSTLALTNIDRHGKMQFSAVDDSFQTKALGYILGLEFQEFKVPMTKTRQLFIEQCKELEVVGRENLEEAVKMRKNAEIAHERELQQYHSLPWYKKLINKKPN